jgi:hypothetical protein
VKKCLVHPSENVTKFQKTCKPLILVHMDNTRVDTARETQEKLDVSRFKRTARPPYRPDIEPSDFFAWLNLRLNGENMMGNMNYMK